MEKMAKKQPALFGISQKTILLVFILVLFVATVAVAISTKQTTQNSKQYKAAVDLINFTNSRHDFETLAKELTAAKKTGFAAKSAKQILAKALGLPPYRGDLAAYSEKDFADTSLSKDFGLIPAAIHLATLCEQNQSQSPTSCQKTVKLLSEKIDFARRLTTLYMIEAQVPNECVKADLGTEPHLNATTIQGNNPGVKTRLYICTGEPGDIKFRSPARSGTLTRVRETFTTADTNAAAQVVSTCILSTPLTSECNLKTQ